MRRMQTIYRFCIITHLYAVVVVEIEPIWNMNQHPQKHFPMKELNLLN